MASQQAFTHTVCIILSLIPILSSPCALCALLPSTPLNLQYHEGPLLAGAAPIKLHLTFYGDFTALEMETIKSFLHSLSAPTPAYLAQFSSYNTAPHKSRRLSPIKSSASSSSSALQPLLLKQPSTEQHSKPLAASGGSSLKSAREYALSSRVPSPTVAKWWSLTQAYTDLRGNAVSQTVLVEHEASDNYSHGKLLSRSALASLAKISARRAARAVSHAAQNTSNIHLIFTAADVAVEGFCMHACGQHAHTDSDGELGTVVYAWVGNAREQCPGYCAWPFVPTEYGPEMEPLKAPNTPSADGMIISLAKVLVEAATNPFGDGYYLGGGGAHGVGVGSICTGAYGDGAYPGYPGHTLRDGERGASYNVEGLNQMRFLLPYIWNPVTHSCAVQG